MMEMSRSRAIKALVPVVGGFALSVLSASAAEAREYTVSMQNMAFGAIPSGLKVGDTLIWANKDSVPHTVTARDHSFDLRIGPGQSGRVTLTKAGSYQIYCVIHSPMRASFTVGS
jgi:plastocyanin